MSWEDAIRKAIQDEAYSLVTLTPEDAKEYFESKIDQKKVEDLIKSLQDTIASNKSNAEKMSSIVAILQSVVRIGSIFA